MIERKGRSLVSPPLCLIALGAVTDRFISKPRGIENGWWKEQEAGKPACSYVPENAVMHAQIKVPWDPSIVKSNLAYWTEIAPVDPVTVMVICLSDSVTTISVVLPFNEPVERKATWDCAAAWPPTLNAT